MNNDPFPVFEYLSQTQIASLFGVTATEVGGWLIGLGLRQTINKPTPRAMQEGLVKEVSTGTMNFFSWHKERVVSMLEAAGHRRDHGHGHGQVAEPPKPTKKGIHGPFQLRPNSVDGDFSDILNVDGTVGMWIEGQENAKKVLSVLNLAHKHGLF